MGQGVKAVGLQPDATSLPEAARPDVRHPVKFPTSSQESSSMLTPIPPGNAQTQQPGNSAVGPLDSAPAAQPQGADQASKMPRRALAQPTRVKAGLPTPIPTSVGISAGSKESKSARLDGSSAGVTVSGDKERLEDPSMESRSQDAQGMESLPLSSNAKEKVSKEVFALRIREAFEKLVTDSESTPNQAAIQAVARVKERYDISKP